VDEQRGFSADLVAAALIAFSAAEARVGELGSVERAAFEALNGLPDRAHLPVAAVMQAGSLAAVGVVSAGTLALGRRSAAARIGFAGGSAWLAAKGLKREVGRGRPAAVGAARILGRPQTGLGFPSGHAAVAAAMASAASPDLGPWGRAGAWSLAVGVGMARIYVGAHLPHDVVGGLALGALLGRTARRVPTAWLDRAQHDDEEDGDAL
jgi:undecaprenyl-diphosphatase